MVPIEPEFVAFHRQIGLDLRSCVLLANSVRGNLFTELQAQLLLQFVAPVHHTRRWLRYVAEFRVSVSIKCSIFIV